jgi:Zn-dependent peptidase ImmA (M78 family)
VQRSQVERQAAAFLARFHSSSVPVPVEEIAVEAGLRVIRSSADWNESGFLLRDGATAIIGINSRNSARRQRFTIAHELGHWVLHKGKPLIVDQSVMVNKRDDVSSQATNQEEIEANQFAAALLMPKSMILPAVETQMSGGMASRDELISSMSRQFDVSADAMGWRLINMGILST